MLFWKVVNQKTKMRSPGLEPGPPAWKADVLTTTLRTLTHQLRKKVYRVPKQASDVTQSFESKSYCKAEADPDLKACLQLACYKDCDDGGARHSRWGRKEREWRRSMEKGSEDEICWACAVAAYGMLLYRKCEWLCCRGRNRLATETFRIQLLQSRKKSRKSEGRMFFVEM